jgi:hypothetical protein
MCSLVTSRNVKRRTEELSLSSTAAGGPIPCVMAKLLRCLLWWICWKTFPGLNQLSSAAPPPTALLVCKLSRPISFSSSYKDITHREKGRVTKRKRMNKGKNGFGFEPAQKKKTMSTSTCALGFVKFLLLLDNELTVYIILYVHSATGSDSKLFLPKPTFLYLKKK